MSNEETNYKSLLCLLKTDPVELSNPVHRSVFEQSHAVITKLERKRDELKARVAELEEENQLLQRASLEW